MGLFQCIQGKASLGACLLLTLSLSACDSKTPIERVDVVAPVTTVEQVSKVVKEKPKKKLNLTLSDDVMAISKSGSTSTIDVAEINLDEHNMLPNMFGDKREGTTVGGGILRDAENEDYVDSIQGAEVNVEFKID